MRLIKNILLTFTLSVICISSQAQDVYKNYLPIESDDSQVEGTSERVRVEPVPLTQTRYSDVLWSKIVTRFIDFKEDKNSYFQYPVGQSYDIKNLFETILEDIKNGVITPYDAVGSKELGEKISYTQIMERLGAASDSISVIDPETGESEITVISEDPKLEEVDQMLIKEFWFFDNVRGEMDVRIMAICPIRTFYRDGDVNRTTPVKSALCWVAYPECREGLANSFTGTERNNIANLSYDNILISRRFNGYIINESRLNGRSSRESVDFGIDDIEQLKLESDKIEEEIFTVEKHLWGEGRGATPENITAPKQKKSILRANKKAKPKDKSKEEKEEKPKKEKKSKEEKRLEKEQEELDL